MHTKLWLSAYDAGSGETKAFSGVLGLDVLSPSCVTCHCSSLLQKGCRKPIVCLLATRKFTITSLVALHTLLMLQLYSEQTVALHLARM